MSNLSETLATLEALQRSGDRVTVGYTVDSGPSVREMKVMSASDASQYVTAVARTLDSLGMRAQFTLTRWED